MVNVDDFLAAVGERPEEKYPSVSLKDCKFKLVDWEPVHKWFTTGEEKADGSPRWAKEEKPNMSDDGQKMQTFLRFSVTDAQGLATADSAPFEIKKYLSLDEVKALKKKVGSFVQLENPRIVFRTMSERRGNFDKIVTRISFDCGAIL